VTFPGTLIDEGKDMFTGYATTIEDGKKSCSQWFGCNSFSWHKTSGYTYYKDRSVSLCGSIAFDTPSPPSARQTIAKLDPAVFVKPTTTTTTTTTTTVFVFSCWEAHDNKYSGGYADGTGYVYVLAEAKTECDLMGADRCKAITCSKSQDKCTLRASDNLGSSYDEISYKRTDCPSTVPPTTSTAATTTVT